MDEFRFAFFVLIPNRFSALHFASNVFLFHKLSFISRSFCLRFLKFRLDSKCGKNTLFCFQWKCFWLLFILFCFRTRVQNPKPTVHPSYLLHHPAEQLSHTGPDPTKLHCSLSLRYSQSPHSELPCAILSYNTPYCAISMPSHWPPVMFTPENQSINSVQQGSIDPF